MPHCYMMVGVPGSGKSTAIKELVKEMPYLHVVSTDEYIDRVATEQGKSYNEVHSSSIDDATKWMKAELHYIIKDKKDFVWDQTNIVKSARMKKLRNLFSNGYEVTAIVFEIPMDELHNRLEKRANETGKSIPKKVMEDMIRSYQRPDYDEGFKSILLNETGAYYELPKPSILTGLLLSRAKVIMKFPP